MKNKIANILKEEHDEYLALRHPQLFAVELMIEKNLWITKIRWIYSFFILVFFVTYNTFLSNQLIEYRTLALILLLAIFGNICFVLILLRGLKNPLEKRNFELYKSLASLQMDFDLIILSLVIFFSKGFNSSMVVLYVFYIMIATFLIQDKKAFKNALTAIILVVVIFFSGDHLNLSVSHLIPLVSFLTFLLFAYLISSYLSKNLKESENKLHDLLEKTHALSVTDGLTNLYNQTHFFLLLRLQIEKSKRYHTPFSLIIFDVDNFKNYNDKNGHIKGSAVLRRIGDLMRSVFRSTDVLAKYGGDEFVVILPSTDKVGAFLAADRFREVVEEEKFEGRETQPQGKVTVSIGIAGYPEHGQTVEEILDRADKALYFAKNNGRNKAVIYNADLDELVN
ncbi:MAG: GGDEF domain-containing protein [Candidatus Omnitrophota bacterium]